jgi:hypothetical protein
MLTIKRYDKDLNTGVIYGWDLAKAFEGADYYVFEFHERIGDSLPVTCRIERKMTRNPLSDGYMCEVFQVGGSWSGTYILEPKHIKHSVLLYELVENVIGEYN